MLKHGFLATILALLFAATPAMADEHSEKHEQFKHPAHEMGKEAESDSDEKEPLSEEAKENLEKAKDTENPPHPAHRMGDDEELKERGAL